MPITELKTFRITCDGCREHYGDVASVWMPTLPRGWDRRQVHNCGSTGYTRTDVLCAECLAKSDGSERPDGN